MNDKFEKFHSGSLWYIQDTNMFRLFGDNFFLQISGNSLNIRVIPLCNYYKIQTETYWTKLHD